MSLPDSASQRYSAAIAGIKLSHLGRVELPATDIPIPAAEITEATVRHIGKVSDRNEECFFAESSSLDSNSD
jgi:hypothetical protein